MVQRGRNKRDIPTGRKHEGLKQMRDQREQVESTRGSRDGSIGKRKGHRQVETEGIHRQVEGTRDTNRCKGKQVQNTGEHETG